MADQSWVPADESVFVSPEMRALLACVNLPQPMRRKADHRRHQLVGHNFALPMAGAMLAMGVGAGKSKTAVDLAASTDAKLVVVSCPKSVLGVWRREFAKWCAVDHQCLILESGTAKDKADRAWEAIVASRQCGTMLAVVSNFDSVWRDPLGSLLIRAKPDLWVADESHRLADPQTAVSRYHMRAARAARRRLALTGTPMPNSPLAVFSQFRFVDATVFGTQWLPFRTHFAVTDPQYPSRVLSFKNMGELHKRFYTRAYRVKSSDVLDLPPLTTVVREVEMSAAAWRIYDQISEELVATLPSGRILETPHILTQLLRLQQVTSGHAPAVDPDRVVTGVERLGSWKTDALTEILGDCDERVVVFCRFVPDLDEVSRAAAAAGRRYGEISGRRKDLTPHATMPDDVDVMGVQIQSGGVGIDLTGASLAVLYSIGYTSPGAYEQAIGRLHRPGQDNPVRVVQLVARGTVDEDLYDSLERKTNVIEGVLSGLRVGRGRGVSMVVNDLASRAFSPDPF